MAKKTNSTTWKVNDRKPKKTRAMGFSDDK